MMTAMPGGEAEHDRVGNELDDPAQPGEPQPDQEEAGHDRGDGEAGQPVLGHDPGHDDDEGPGGPPDLDPGPAQEGDQQAGDNGGVEAPLGGDPAGDGEGDGQGEGHDADDQAGAEIRGKLAPGIALGEDGEEFGLEGRHWGLRKVATGLKISRRRARIAVPQVRVPVGHKVSGFADLTLLRHSATLMGSRG